jgi:ribosomal protein S18 acetylase RimI-like enzyme
MSNEKPADFVIRRARASDYGSMYAFWKATPGLGVTPADERKPFLSFLRRNRRACFVATRGKELVGTALGGNDGRRGYVYHLAVAPDCRGRGLANELVSRVIAGFASYGLDKCHLFVLGTNELGIGYYRANDWKERTDLLVFSKDVR